MGKLAPKVGDECISCAAFWDSQKLPRKTLVLIGTTQNKHVMMLVCPYCDGERAISLSKTKP